MHSIAEIGTNVPAFLGKLWTMVEDPVTNDLISWSSTGTSFVIKDEIRFARELLPMYYKHNNMASFIRQLNMYGFHKIVSPDAGSMKLETPDEIKFTHPFFMQGHPYLLENIKRKIGANKVSGEMGEKTPQVINKVLSDVRQMKGRQESLDSRLTCMKVENEALWRELSILRQKHLKQQQIVNKLIQFLVTIVHQNHSNFSVKRKYPRMLQHDDKSVKQQVTHPDEAPEHSSDTSNSPKGPVIHELDPAEALLETVVEEAEAETPTAEASDYFFNPEENKTIGEMVGVEIPQEAEACKVNGVNAETIIGLPEDTLMSNSLCNQTNRSNVIYTRATPLMYQPSQKVIGETEIQRPKLIKVVTKRPRKNGETKLKQVIVSTPQNQTKETLQQKLPTNQHQLEHNKQQIMASEQQQLHSRHSKSQSINQQSSEKNRHILPKLRQHHAQKNLQQHLQKAQLTRSQENTQTKNSQQRILLQTLQKNKQPLSPKPANSEHVITVPLDSRPTRDVIANVNDSNLNPLYVKGETNNLSLPGVLDEPTLTTSPTQISSTSPAALSPQDLLISSPLMISDPVVMPIVTSPADSHSRDMQVACVEEPVTTSNSNIVTRSAHHHIFKVEPPDYSRSEMDNHIETVQNDFDNLRELLHSEGISLDANTLLGYFNDDPLSYNMPEPSNNEEPKESSGNELMACNPSLFDFTDLMGNDWSLPTSPGENLVTAGEDLFAEVNTPQFVPQSPSFTTPSKKRKK